MNCKELWFVRHTETVTPESYDFDLSRKGKRDARMLGWHLAQQSMATPTIILHSNARRGVAMRNALRSQLEIQPSARILNGIFPNIVASESGYAAYPWMLLIARSLDGLAWNSDGGSIKTAVFIVHRHQAPAFDLLKFILASDTGKSIRELSDDELELNIGKIGKTFAARPKSFEHGGFVRIRFPVASWREITIGTGEVIAEGAPATVRPSYRAWHQAQRTLRLQQPAQ